MFAFYAWRVKSAHKKDLIVANFFDYENVEGGLSSSINCGFIRIRDSLKNYQI